MKQLKKVLKNNRGQGMLEYVMLLAVVALVVLAFKGQIKSQIEKLTGDVANKSNEVLQ